MPADCAYMRMRSSPVRLPSSCRCCRKRIASRTIAVLSQCNKHPQTVTANNGSVEHPLAHSADNGSYNANSATRRTAFSLAATITACVALTLGPNSAAAVESVFPLPQPQDQQQQEMPHLRMPMYLRTLQQKHDQQQKEQAETIQPPDSPQQQNQRRPQPQQQQQQPSLYRPELVDQQHIGQPAALMSECKTAEQAQSNNDGRRTGPLLSSNPIAMISAIFGFGKSETDEEPVDPFVLYGTTFKQFYIAKMQGEKIVSRQRGFTVNTCTAGIATASETPSFQGLATGARVNSIPDRTCRAVEGLELKPTCVRSCDAACTDGLDLYTSESSASLGFKVPASAQERVLRSCRRQCVYECAKPGKAYDFSIPFRP